MALVSLLFVYFIIIICLLVGLFVVGWIIAIIGLANEKKVKLYGKKYPHVCISIGLYMVAIPVVFVLYVFGTVGINTLKLNIERKGYENFVDKWQNENVSANEAGDEAVRWIIEAAENNDKDKIMEVFTEEIQSDSEFSAQIDEFLEAYPGGFSGLEIESKGGHDYTDSDNGNIAEYMSYSYELVKDNVYYYIDFEACIRHEGNSSKVGIEQFVFKSERAEVYFQDVSEDFVEYNEYITAKIDFAGDFTVRQINGYPRKFYEFGRNITKDDVLEAVKYAKNIENIERMLGTPNLNHLTLRTLIYELNSGKGQPMYAEIGYDYYGTLDGDVYFIDSENSSNNEHVNIKYDY